MCALFQVARRVASGGRRRGHAGPICRGSAALGSRRPSCGGSWSGTRRRVKRDRFAREGRMTSVKVSPSVGPPTAHTSASGTGFEPDEVVEVYFDGVAVVRTTTDLQGKFSKGGFQVPAS